ncbi:MAG: hypothetical protein GKR90_07115 [Pseudomonadales bacterium]|nr:hypothetical protein [Pseudomonadales bacterium]
MNSISWTWSVCAALFLAFFSWYTSFGGPLTESEIDTYMAYFELSSSDGTPERLTSMRRFMEEDTGDDFVMVNVIEMYDKPLAISGVDPDDSSDAVLGKYMEYMYPALFARASHPVLVGEAANVAMDLMNAPGMHAWTRGAGMRYRSRRDLLEIATNPEFSGSHEFKVAAMAKTIAFPIDPWWQLGDPRLILGLLLALIASSLSWFFSAKRG